VNPLPLHEGLRRTVDALLAAGIRYMICGSLASSRHGEPRSTYDFDVVADVAHGTRGSRDSVRRLDAEGRVAISGSWNAPRIAVLHPSAPFLENAGEVPSVQLGRVALGADEDAGEFVFTAEPPGR